jgi:hypothetical protein
LSPQNFNISRRFFYNDPKKSEDGTGKTNFGILIVIFIKSLNVLDENSPTNFVTFLSYDIVNA